MPIIFRGNSALNPKEIWFDYCTRQLSKNMISHFGIKFVVTLFSFYYHISDFIFISAALSFLHQLMHVQGLMFPFHVTLNILCIRRLSQRL